MTNREFYVGIVVRVMDSGDNNLSNQINEIGFRSIYEPRSNHYSLYTCGDALKEYVLMDYYNNEDGLFHTIEKMDSLIAKLKQLIDKFKKTETRVMERLLALAKTEECECILNAGFYELSW